MKNVVKVSIAGISFVFDEVAYQVMQEYLERLTTAYAKNPDGREIVADIEARIAELILTEQESEKIVGKPLADNIVAQLGYPDDIAGSADIPVEEFPRRLYRNPDGAIIGGVCSGIGTYFKIDPVWVRLGFFAPLILAILAEPLNIYRSAGFFGLLSGVFFLLYFILWISIPMARNPRQKLEMRGEKITASSIKQNFEEDAEVISPSPKQKRSASVWADVMYGIGKIFLILLKIFVVFIAVIVGVVALSLLIGIFAVLFSGTLILNGYSVHGLESFAGMEGISPVAYASLLMLAILIPVIVVGYLLLRLLFSKRTSKSFLSIAGAIWLITVIYLAIMTFRNVDNIRSGVIDLRYRIESYDFGGAPLRDKEFWEEQLRDKELWQEQWRNYDPDLTEPEWKDPSIEAPYREESSDWIEKERAAPETPREEKPALVGASVPQRGRDLRIRINGKEVLALDLPNYDETRVREALESVQYLPIKLIN